MTWIQTLRHRLAHVFGWNGCVVFDWTDTEGHHVGGMCATCGQIHPDTIVTFRR